MPPQDPSVVKPFDWLVNLISLKWRNWRGKRVGISATGFRSQVSSLGNSDLRLVTCDLKQSENALQQLLVPFGNKFLAAGICDRAREFDFIAGNLAFVGNLELHPLVIQVFDERDLVAGNLAFN